MDVRYRKSLLERLETDRGYDGGLSAAVVKAFRKRMQSIYAATDGRDLLALESLHIELQEKPAYQYLMRFNETSTAIGVLNHPNELEHRYAMPFTNKRRLILEFESDGPDTVVAVVDMEDYNEELDHAAQKNS